MRSILALLALSSTVAAAPVVEIGTLPGGYHSVADDRNEAGQVVGWSDTSWAFPERHAILWQDGVMTDLSDGLGAGAAMSRAVDINEVGQVVLRACLGNEWSNDCTVWRWTAGVLEEIGPGRGGVINEAGHVVVFGPDGELFFWDGGALEPLPSDGYVESIDLTDDGRVLINSDGPDVIWSRDGVITFPPDLQPVAMNNLGVVAVKAPAGPRLWIDGALHEMAGLPCDAAHPEAWPTSIDDDGRVLIRGRSRLDPTDDWGKQDYENRAFLWKDGVVTVLESGGTPLATNRRGDAWGYECFADCECCGYHFWRGGRSVNSGGGIFTVATLNDDGKIAGTYMVGFDESRERAAIWDIGTAAAPDLPGFLPVHDPTWCIYDATVPTPDAGPTPDAHVPVPPPSFDVQVGDPSGDPGGCSAGGRATPTGGLLLLLAAICANRLFRKHLR